MHPRLQLYQLSCLTSKNERMKVFYENILFPVAAMTVSNGDSNGETNGHTAAPVLEKGSWTVGLVNSRHKYLSAETFGFKINANGKTMKKKQVSWY